MQGLTRYGFRQAASGFFEFPTENARRILPSHIEPVELHHGSSIFSLTAFDFTESMVGPYGEVVMSVIVSPLVKPGKPLPKSAFYPYLVATTTRAAREHAIERWHLPHYMKDIDLRWDRGDGHVTIHATERGQPIVDMTVTEFEWSRVEHRYQAFMHDEEGFYSSTIVMAGQFSENEEEKGGIVIHTQAMTELLEDWELTTTPFRELWMKNGVQTFHPLQQLASYARR
jgi:hypothetical protein